MENATKGRTIAFIDNSYVFSGMLAAGWRISWERLHKRLGRDGDVWQTHFFATEHIPPKDNQRNFFNILSYNLGYEIHLTSTRQRFVKCDECGASKVIYVDKGADVALVTSLLILLKNNSYDTALILSGDGDYVDALREVKRCGKRIEIVGWRNSVSRELDEIASKRPILFLDDIRDDIEKNDDYML